MSFASVLLCQLCRCVVAASVLFQERHSGLAQIADVYLQSPRLAPACGLPPYCSTNAPVLSCCFPAALLLLQERYFGLAQIADVYFQSPRLLPVELIVFEDRSCLGLLWQHPMDSFSLLNRLEDLP
jgi:hypothetical protein